MFDTIFRKRNSKTTYLSDYDEYIYYTTASTRELIPAPTLPSFSERMSIDWDAQSDSLVGPVEITEEDAGSAPPCVQLPVDVWILIVEEVLLIISNK